MKHLMSLVCLGVFCAAGTAVAQQTFQEAHRTRLLEPAHLVCIPAQDGSGEVTCHILMQSKYSETGDPNYVCELVNGACRSGYQGYMGTGEGCVGFITCTPKKLEVVATDPPPVPVRIKAPAVPKKPVTPKK